MLKENREQYEKLIVIPCVDYYTALLVRNLEKFNGLIANPLPEKELFEAVYSKPSFYELCAKSGLFCPETVIVEPSERKKTGGKFPFPYPVVLKPENSMAESYVNCTFPGKQKVYFPGSPEEYLAAAAKLDAAGYTGKLVVQEYIPGGDTCAFTVNTYSDANGILRAAACGQVLLDDPAPAMRGNNIFILSRENEEIMEKVKHFLSETGYTGFADIDMKKDPRSGKLLFFELNPRLGRSHMFARASGLNMMKVMIDDVVYGIRQDPVYARDEALYLDAPKGLLKKYVKDTELKEKAERLIREGKYLSSRWDKGDMNLRRAFILLRYDAGLRHALRKYSG